MLLNKRMVVSFITLVSISLFAACQPLQRNNPTDTDTYSNQDRVEKLPFETPAKPTELNPDIVYNLLTAEIATQRNELELAYVHQMEAAKLSNDAESAERATRLGIYLKRHDLAEKAVKLWVKVAPNDITARQIAAMLYLRADEMNAALRELKAILAISEAKGTDGFLQAMAALNREKDQRKVIELMRRLKQEYEDDPRAGHALALTALIAKRPDLAEKEIALQIERHPNWTRSYLLQSRIRISQNDKKGAQEILQSALKRFPSDIQLITAYASLLIDTKEYELAYKQFQKLVALEPDKADTRFSLSILAMQLEKQKQARLHLKTLIEMDKRTNEAAYYLGRIDEMESRPEQAVEWYQKVAGGEFQIEAQMRLAHLMAEQGRLLEAREWLRGMRIRLPKQSVKLFVVEADILKEHGKPEEVMEIYAKGLRAHPDDSDLLYSRALYAATQDKLELLESDLNKVIAKDPDNADALNALGYTLADQTNRYEEALGYIERALAIKPEEPAILDSMGWVHYRMGNYPRALKYLKEALDQMPDPEIAAHYGEVLWKIGERERARKIWQESLKENPDNKHLLEVMQRLDE